FTTSPPVNLVREQFSRAGREHLVAILAYCFMPDHVHLLVEGTREDSDLKPFQSAAKQYSAFHFKKQFGVTLWQRYAYEHVLREQEETFETIRYLLANPVRAGLVETVNGYPFSGSE